MLWKSFGKFLNFKIVNFVYHKTQLLYQYFLFLLREIVSFVFPRISMFELLGKIELTTSLASRH